MKVKALEIRLGARRIGVLVQYALPDEQVVSRFLAADHFMRDPAQPTLSSSFLTPEPEAQVAFWSATAGPLLNGVLSRSANRGWLLPAFFQNLLPEGPLRARIAKLRECDPNDHFELLAASGNSLPGDVQVLPARLSRQELGHLAIQDTAAMEMSVVAVPLADCVSVPGVQSKLGVLKLGERFVARSELASDTDALHVIAKLPVAGRALLPELEHLSLRLASAAGVSVVEAELAPLERLAVEHGYDLGDVNGRTNFLAVFRYDRDVTTATRRVHCEDFAQVLGVQPENKYTQSYLAVATVLASTPSLGEPAVHELLRRILVNDLMGNPDMHLKNIGLRYADGRTPDLPPAYDLVAYAAYGVLRHGRALHLVPPPPGAVPAQPQRLGPVVVRDFCARLGLPERPAWAALRHCAAKAAQAWPALIQGSTISPRMKERLLERLATYATREKR